MTYYQIVQQRINQAEKELLNLGYTKEQLEKIGVACANSHKYLEELLELIDDLIWERETYPREVLKEDLMD